MINPERSDFLRRWDILMVALLGFVAWVSPVQVSIVGTDTLAMRVVSSMVDVLFLVDLALQFFMMRQVKTDYGFRWVANPLDIAILYLKGWFALDLISVIPFDSLVMINGSADIEQVGVVKITRCLRLLKLARLTRLSRILRRVETRLNITQGRLQLIKFFLILALIIHWLASLWCFTLVLQDDEPQWLTALSETEEAQTRDAPWRLYFTSLYFTAYTVTSVGYGDISPKNILERLVCTMMLVASGVTWAVFIGEVCHFSATMTQHERDWRQSMDDLTAMERDRVITREMRLRMRDFLILNRAVVWAAHGRGRREVLMSYMSPGLKGEASLEINRPWIVQVSFLRHVLESIDSAFSTVGPLFRTFIFELSERISTEVYAQSESFGRPQVLYVLRRGLVSGYRRVWSAGTVLGTDFVLADANTVTPINGAALTYADLNVLRRLDFMELVLAHRDVIPLLFQQVRRFACWTAFQRAVLKQASQRELLPGTVVTTAANAFWG